MYEIVHEIVMVWFADVHFALFAQRPQPGPGALSASAPAARALEPQQAASLRPPVEAVARGEAE